MTKRNSIAILFSLLLSLGLWAGCSEDDVTNPPVNQLTLSPSALAFTSLVTAVPSPAQRTVVIKIDGRAVTDWTVEEDADWIEIGPSGTDTIFVTIRSENLPAGSFIDTIFVRSPLADNSPQLLIVNLEVADWIQTNVDSLEFTSLSGGSNPDSQWVELASLSGSMATYTASTTAPWLSVGSSTGDIPDSIAVEVDISGLGGGIYTDSVVFLSPELNNSRATVKVVSRISSWSQQTLGIVGLATSLEGVAFADASIGYLSGWRGSAVDPRGLVFKTTNGGADWLTVANIPNVRLGRPAVISDSLVWVAADSGRLVQTTDGGSSWTTRKDLPLDSSQSLTQVTFSGVRYGWAVGAFGTAIHTSDSGNTWTTQNVNTSFALNDIAMINPLDGWICGNHGEIYRTTNGGLTWDLQPSGTVEDLKSISAVDVSNAWTVGDEGLILATSNGGGTWSVQTSGTGEQLRAVYFVDPDLGWAAGWQGTIIQTSDGGDNWLIQLSGTTNTFFDQVFIDENIGWTIGEKGTILKTLSGGF